jgi:hypothetical protein
MSTPSAKAVPSGGKAATKTTTTTVVKTTTTTTTKQPHQKLVSTFGAGSKVKKAKTTASGKKVVNSHGNRPLNNNGLMRFSRGRMFHRRALYRINKWKGDQAKLQGDKTKKTAGSIQKKKQRTPALKKKPVGGERNGKERLVRTKRFVSRLFCWISFVLSSIDSSLVIIQRKTDQKNFPLNEKDSEIMNAVFDHHSHPVPLSFLLPVNMLEK